MTRRGGTTKSLVRGRGGTALAFLLGLLIATAGTATAAKLITGKQIKDGSIGLKDLSKPVRAKLAEHGARGATGATGAQGPKGDPGAKGDTGPQGPGARSFTASLAKSAGSSDLATLDNGLKVVGVCGINGVSVTIETTSGDLTFEGSGLVGRRTPSTEAYNVGGDTGTSGVGFGTALSGHLDAVARDKALGGRFAHISVGGVFTDPAGCRFWGMITPAG
jgi:hypothetical protein